MISSIIAMAFYALEISLTDWQLSAVSPRLLTFFYSAGVAAVSLASLLGSGQPQALPDGKQALFIVLMVLASFVAASAHFHALSVGTGAVRLTMAYMLLPVAASCYMFAFRLQLPDARTAAAWLLAAAALYLVSLQPAR